ncbi:hypothetical protein, partial [Burkholderia vietnamiensis]|uniref:hypothetical protein n=1 Tax=Burkholderia vietnamiensis TaxID=60552 RepID=UPI001ABAD490
MLPIVAVPVMVAFPLTVESPLLIGAGPVPAAFWIARVPGVRIALLTAALDVAIIGAAIVPCA